jgi:hypothetical protein
MELLQAIATMLAGVIYADQLMRSTPQILPDKPTVIDTAPLSKASQHMLRDKGVCIMTRRSCIRCGLGK